MTSRLLKGSVGAVAVLAAVLLYTLGNRTPGVSDPRPTVVASQPGTAGTVALPAPGDLPVAGSAQDQAVAAALGLDRREQLIVVSVATDPNGAGHIRYRRTFDGLRVVGGDFVAHLDAAGVVRDVSWNLGGKVVVPSTTPTITLDEAKAAAAGPPARSGDLVVYVGKAGPVLAYDVVAEGVGTDQTPYRIHTVVDARTGVVLTSWDDIHTGM